MVRMALIGIAVAIPVTLVAVLIPWLPTSASKQMDRIEFVFWFATIICIAIFSLVMAVLLYSVLSFRAPPEDLSDGPSIHGNTTLEIAWTVVPAILVIAIGVLSAIVLSQNGNAGTNPMVVKVTAQQFAWRFEYPASKNLKSGTLVLPLGDPIKFQFKALDVIHSFWIPQMGQKQDLVPGIDTSLVITPTRTGTFSLVCTELCGLGHATMRAVVNVVSKDDFAAWVEKQQSGGGSGASGAALFASAGCSGCHAFTPAGSAAAIGPNLDNVAASAAKAGQSTEEYVKESIVNPNKIVAPGYAPGVMPGNFADTLSAKEIDALVQYVVTGAKK